MTLLYDLPAGHYLLIAGNGKISCRTINLLRDNSVHVAAGNIFPCRNYLGNGDGFRSPYYSAQDDYKFFSCSASRYNVLRSI